jgi:hypothetical protein
LPARLRLELRDQNLQLRIPAIAGNRSQPCRSPADSAVDSGKTVLGLENRRLSAGNLIAISILNPFGRYRPTAEIEPLLRWCSGRQWNSTACLVLLNSA